MNLKAYFSLMIVSILITIVGVMIWESDIKAYKIKAGSGPGERIVEAGKILLVDSKGEARASLHLGEGGGPRLDLYDSNGNTRAGLYLLPDGAPRLGLFDPEGMHRALLALMPDGQPGLLFFNENGRPNLTLLFSKEGKSELVLGDKEGAVLWSAP